MQKRLEKIVQRQYQYTKYRALFMACQRPYIFAYSANMSKEDIEKTNSCGFDGQF
jgi:hypothetical protein